MNMIKSWRVVVSVYEKKHPKKVFVLYLDVNGRNEQTVRRLVLNAAHERNRFVLDFLEVERVKT